MKSKLVEPLFYTRHEFARLCACSATTITRWSQADPNFPQPVRVGTSGERYRRSDVLAYLASKGVEVGNGKD